MEAWRDSGAHDLAHWLWLRYGISDWKARRWIQAAHALEGLPRIAAALARGELGIDKVVELTRFAAPETEADLIRWAARVSVGRIRRRGDILLHPSIDEVRDAERDRSLSWWYFDEGRRFGLEAELPAAQGAVVAAALERMSDELPAMPDEEATSAESRRADALVAMASARIAAHADPDRATVWSMPRSTPWPANDLGATLEGGGVIHPETASRLACNARIQMVVEDDAGRVVRLGRMTREPPAWMIRQLRYRDDGCTFPGCGSRRFTHAHDIVWWERGGRTELENLALVCSFHHRLVHEHGWSIRRDADGAIRWFRADGVRYRAGPGPPEATPEHRAEDEVESELRAG
jgi:Domain of unknown function (DUF222)